MIVLLWAVTDSLMFDVGPFTCVSVCVGSYSHIGWWFDHLINWSTTPNTEHGLQVTVSLIHDSSKSTRSEWLTSFPLSPCHLFWCCSFELQASRRSSTMKYINTKEIFRVVGVTTVYEPAQIRLESCKITERNSTCPSWPARIIVVDVPPLLPLPTLLRLRSPPSYSYVAVLPPYTDSPPLYYDMVVVAVECRHSCGVYCHNNRNVISHPTVTLL